MKPWLLYIGWIQETYITGSLRKNLVPVLEKCFDIFQHDRQYQQDFRFLKLWIVYADCVKCPDEIFAFMQYNAVGTTHALFYRAFSAYLFSIKSYEKAEDVLQQGINLHAKPTQQLKSELKSLQTKVENIKMKQKVRAHSSPHLFLTNMRDRFIFSSSSRLFILPTLFPFIYSLLLRTPLKIRLILKRNLNSRKKK